MSFNWARTAFKLHNIFHVKNIWTRSQLHLLIIVLFLTECIKKANFWKNVFSWYFSFFYKITLYHWIKPGHIGFTSTLYGQYDIAVPGIYNNWNKNYDEQKNYLLSVGLMGLEGSDKLRTFFKNSFWTNLLIQLIGDIIYYDKKVLIWLKYIMKQNKCIQFSEGILLANFITIEIRDLKR